VRGKVSIASETFSSVAGSGVREPFFVEAASVGCADHDEGEALFAGGAFHAGNHGPADALSPVGGVDGELADLGSAGDEVAGEVSDDLAVFNRHTRPGDVALHELLDEGSADPGTANGLGESLCGDADHSGDIAEAW